MKKIIIGVIAMFISVCVMAQAKVTPPAKAAAAFTKKYPGAAKVKWEKENGNFEASFVNAGQKMSAIYNSEGDQLETETAIAG